MSENNRKERWFIYLHECTEICPLAKIRPNLFFFEWNYCKGSYSAHTYIVHTPIYAAVLQPIKTGQQNGDKASGSVCVHAQKKPITVGAKLH